MNTPAVAVSLFVAALHVGFFVLESILWTKPIGRKVFAMKREQAEATKSLALNQGGYNGGIAIVLAWAALAPNPPAAIAVLAFIVAMGALGAASVKVTILYIQALPAAVALALWLI